ncbi:hypothetical protein PCANC_05020 [Puccinia coronata f. sp. avenae]|uniref:Uncharacterized protein n=1 Tax=Puccinia coronata f. sp. avenae TaxID=200324 RepID=A0A2N5T7N3_9BASI|nr:hypothetical protein PCANC_05020 [Puccinia coronata f. sp. avenae]
MSSPSTSAQTPKVSHPMFVVGPWDIIEVGANTLQDLQLYGQFSYVSSIPAQVPPHGEINAVVNVAGYGSRNNALIAGNLYILFGRLVQSSTSGQFHFLFEQQMNMCLGSSTPFLPRAGGPNPLFGKTAVFGYGVVDSTNEVTVPSARDTVSKNLCVTLTHTDYHTLHKKQVIFKTIYTIPGNQLLRGTFRGFYIGREVVLAGFISGFDEDKAAWEVQVILVSLSSGARATNNNNNTRLIESSQPKRPNLKRFGVGSAPAPSSLMNQTPSTPSLSNPSSGPATTPTSVPAVCLNSPSVVPPPIPLHFRQLPSVEHPEDGEISDDENNNHFTNTFKPGTQRSLAGKTGTQRTVAGTSGGRPPKGTSTSDTLSQAQKKLRALQ